MAVTFSTGDKDYIPKLNQMADEFAQTEAYRNEVADIRQELVNIAGGLPLVKGDYGVGSDVVPTINDLTQDVPTGFYKFRADYPGAPEATSTSTLWYAGFITKGHGNRVTYDFILVTGGTPRKFAGERIGTTGGINWREIHPDITELISGNDVANMPDINGFYAIEAPSGILNFPEASGNWQFINLNRSSSVLGKIAYSALLAVNRDTGKMYTGSCNVAREEGDKFRWYEVHHSGNVNVKTFGGNTAGDIIGEGEALSASVARLYFELNFFNVPTSIIHEGSNPTVDIYSGAGNLIASNITLTLAGNSSNRRAVCDVSGLSGMTTEQTLSVRIPAADTKLTFVGS